MIILECAYLRGLRKILIVNVCNCPNPMGTFARPCYTFPGETHLTIYQKYIIKFPYLRMYTALIIWCVPCTLFGHFYNHHCNPAYLLFTGIFSQTSSAVRHIVRAHDKAPEEAERLRPQIREHSFIKQVTVSYTLISNCMHGLFDVYWVGRLCDWRLEILR